MAGLVVESIVSHRDKLDELAEEIAATSRLRSGVRTSRMLMKEWKARIADGMGFVLLDGSHCIGLLLYSSDYELRFSSFLSPESADTLPKSVTIVACHVLERARNGSAEREQLLLQSAIARLRTVGSIETIAVQPSPLYELDLEATLSQMGFLSCRRVDMERPLDKSIPELALPPDCTIGPPENHDIDELRSVVYNGYFSEIDGYLFPDIAAVCSQPGLFGEFLSSRSIDRRASVMARMHGYSCGCILVLSGGGRHRGLIGVVATIPTMRRRGVARAMLIRVMRWLAEHRRDRAALAVTVENRPAFKLYSSLGFMEVNRRKAISVWRRSVSRPLRDSGR
jgi:ribosomal protein S18 acetylase RimI-like enzyme